VEVGACETILFLKLSEMKKNRELQPTFERENARGIMEL
jgi:hypothetical protein